MSERGPGAQPAGDHVLRPCCRLIPGCRMSRQTGRHSHLRRAYRPIRRDPQWPRDSTLRLCLSIAPLLDFVEFRLPKILHQAHFLRNWFIAESNKGQRRTHVSVLRCFMVPRRERLKLSDTHFAVHFQFSLCHDVPQQSAEPTERLSRVSGSIFHRCFPNDAPLLLISPASQRTRLCRHLIPWWLYRFHFALRKQKLCTLLDYE